MPFYSRTNHSRDVGINIEKFEMKREQIAKMGDEELQKKTKTHKLTTGILIGLVLIMFAAAFIPSSNEISWPTKILPFSFLPLVIINLLNTRKLIKEIESRKKS